MGDTQHLLLPGHLSHLFGHLLGRPTGDAGIHLVKDQGADLIVLSQYIFQCQHDAGQLAARGHLLNGLQCLAHIGRHQKLHLIHACLVQPPLVIDGGEFHLEAHFRHIQLPQFLLDPLFQLLRRLAALLGQGLCRPVRFLSSLVQILGQPGNGVVSKLDLVQLLAALVQILEHFLYRGAILLFQAVENIQPALHFIQLAGRKLHLTGQVPQGVCRIVGGAAQFAHLPGQFLQGCAELRHAVQFPLCVSQQRTNSSALVVSAQGVLRTLEGVHQLTRTAQQRPALVQLLVLSGAQLGALQLPDLKV